MIGKLLKRVEALEQERVQERGSLKQEIHKLREELDAVQRRESGVDRVRHTLGKPGLERPRGEAGRTGKKGGKTGRKGFSIQEAIREHNPDISWERFVVSLFFIKVLCCQ